jgi:proline dehydrogenase
LLCLAEALLRISDADTIDALIEDKIAPSSWGEHPGRSSSSLVNASPREAIAAIAGHCGALAAIRK